MGLSSFLACSVQFRSVQFRRSATSDSLRPHGLQHARPPCPSTTPRVYSNSCPLNQWCHPIISSSGDLVKQTSHILLWEPQGTSSYWHYKACPPCPWLFALLPSAALCNAGWHNVPLPWLGANATKKLLLSHLPSVRLCVWPTPGS